jgi:hypothetical protein
MHPDNLTNQQKVTAIRDFNLREGIPTEDPDAVLYNGALFEAPQLNQKLFLVAAYEGFNHPLSEYPQDEQYKLITEYSALLASVNRPRACFIGVPGRDPGNLKVTIHTEEVNLQGYWVTVQRTVFLHEPEPIVSIDVIAPSTVRAPPDYPASADHYNTFKAPADIIYEQPADLYEQPADLHTSE